MFKKLSKYLVVILSIFLLLNLTGCNLKLIEKDDTLPAVEPEPEKPEIIIDENSKDTLDENETINETQPENLEPVEEVVEDGAEVINGIKFYETNPETVYFLENSNVYSNATLQRVANSYSKGSSLERVALSQDGAVAKLKTQSGRNYYIDNEKLTTEKPVEEQPAPQQNNSQNNNNNQNNNQNNNNSTNNTNNNNNSSSSNSQQQQQQQSQQQQQQTVCRGVCYPGGNPTTYINGIGFIQSNFTAYISQTAYIYSAPSVSASSEWLAQGTQLNCTAIGEGNWVQVLLANGAYVYIDGQYLTR